MATKVVATATVRAVKNRKILPTRAALVLVSAIFDIYLKNNFSTYIIIITSISERSFQTPAAVNRIKQILEGKNDYVSD